MEEINDKKDIELVEKLKSAINPSEASFPGLLWARTK